MTGRRAVLCRAHRQKTNRPEPAGKKTNKQTTVVSAPAREEEAYKCAACSHKVVYGATMAPMAPDNGAMAPWRQTMAPEPLYGATMAPQWRLEPLYAANHAAMPPQWRHNGANGARQWRHGARAPNNGAMPPQWRHNGAKPSGAIDNLDRLPVTLPKAARVPSEATRGRPGRLPRPAEAEATKAAKAATPPTLVGSGWPRRHMPPQAASEAAKGR